MPAYLNVIRSFLDFESFSPDRAIWNTIRKSGRQFQTEFGVDLIWIKFGEVFIIARPSFQKNLQILMTKQAFVFLITRRFKGRF